MPFKILEYESLQEMSTILGTPVEAIKAMYKLFYFEPQIQLNVTYFVTSNSAVTTAFFQTLCVPIHQQIVQLLIYKAVANVLIKLGQH